VWGGLGADRCARRGVRSPSALTTAGLGLCDAQRKTFPARPAGAGRHRHGRAPARGRARVPGRHHGPRPGAPALIRCRVGRRTPPAVSRPPNFRNPSPLRWRPPTRPRARSPPSRKLLQRERAAPTGSGSTTP
jgi:hypothetical protein